MFINKKGVIPFKTAIAAFFAIALSSCFSSFIDEPVHYVDPGLTYYYESFLVDAAKHGHDFTESNIVFSITDLAGGLRGIHYGRRDDIIHVSIDSDFYHKKKQDTMLMKLLVYHEFGHAFLNKKHDNDCQSMMNQYVVIGCTVAEFRENNRSMIDQLFYED